MGVNVVAVAANAGSDDCSVDTPFSDRAKLAQKTASTQEIKSVCGDAPNGDAPSTDGSVACLFADAEASLREMIGRRTSATAKRM